MSEGLVGGDEDFADDLDDMMPFAFYDDPVIGPRGVATSFTIVNNDKLVSLPAPTIITIAVIATQTTTIAIIAVATVLVATVLTTV